MNSVRENYYSVYIATLSQFRDDSWKHGKVCPAIVTNVLNSLEKVPQIILVKDSDFLGVLHSKRV